jgi:hypothetical protein
MRIYYFDKKDGVPVRDNSGIEFAGPSAAIEHSRKLAEEMRSRQVTGDSDLYIAVIDESGREIHREQVYRDA